MVLCYEVEEMSSLFFHSAKSGHKVDAGRNYEKATFCVVDQSQVVPEKFTNYFRSAIAFGTIKIVENLEEMRHITSVLAMKYAQDHKAEIPARVDASIKNMTIFRLTIEHLTAKEAMELINMRK